MTTSTFKYDVAFTFLTEDESHVQEIKKYFEGALSSFIFTEQQPVIGGTDGMESFPRVFGQESRIVVIMYREKWGLAGMTRVEMESIKERAFEEGQDFIVLVNLDNGKPKWYCGTRIRVILEKYGHFQAAAIIKQRVVDQGGVVRVETVEDRFQRHNAELKQKLDLANFLRTPAAVSEANTEWAKLFGLLSTTSEQLKEPSLGYSYSFSTNPRDHFLISAQGLGLKFQWRHPYSDSLEESRLRVELASVDYFDIHPSRPRNPISRRDYQFTKTRSAPAWVASSDSLLTVSSEHLVQEWFRDLLDHLQRAILKNQRHRFEVR